MRLSGVVRVLVNLEKSPGGQGESRRHLRSFDSGAISTVAPAAGKMAGGETLEPLSRLRSPWTSRHSRWCVFCSGWAGRKGPG